MGPLSCVADVESRFMVKRNPKKTSTFVRAGLPFLLIVIGITAYSNSLNGPFIFDDTTAILNNPYIHSLWPLSRAMFVPPGSSVSARPIASLSLAINYAISGYSVWSYHVVNLIIHLLAGLTLYGIVRRTLLSDRLKNRFSNSAAPLAWMVAVVWLVHPIQTESVTYVIQRVESMMGLFYLFTLYAAIRAIHSKRPAVWLTVSITCCCLGMATKEVMVTAPVLVLLYDRTFGAGSFASALRRRRGFYVGLAATWVVLAALMWTGPRSTSIGFELEGLTAPNYAMSQFGVIVHYLRLCLWPEGLCLDYGWQIARQWTKIIPPMLLILAMLTLTVWALTHNRTWSYLGIWFFGILAPTSSFVPIADLAFEHRMYLPLAAVVVLFVVGGYILLEYLAKRKPTAVTPIVRRTGVLLVIVVISILTGLTLKRNKDYYSAVSIWQTVIDLVPNNPRGYNNLGVVLVEQGRFDEAINRYHQALKIRPYHAEAHSNLAGVLARQGKFDQAVSHYNQAINARPKYAKAHNSLGAVLLLQGEIDQAISRFNQAIQANPDYAEAHNSLGSALVVQGNFDEAIRHFNRAIQLRPDYAEAYNNLGGAFAATGEFDQAVPNFRKALQFAPNDADVHSNLADALQSQGKFDQAIVHYRQALQLIPDSAQMHNDLAQALAMSDKPDEALQHFQKALRLEPDLVSSLLGAARLLVVHPEPNQHNTAQAIALAERAAEVTKHEDPIVLETLAAAYAAAGRLDLAVTTAEEALSLASGTQADYIRIQLELYKKSKP